MSMKVKNIRTTNTKKLIISTFIDLINKKDFAKITITDLANGAGVNRATFYAHFDDKYELLDFIVNDSATSIIQRYTNGLVEKKDIIYALILAVCEFHSQPNIQCRQSYLKLIPQIKEKMLLELKKFLMGLLDKYSEQEKKLLVTIYSSAIIEAGFLWAIGEVKLSKEDIAISVVEVLCKSTDLSSH